MYDIRDYSDRNGIRLTAVVKKGEDPQVLLNQLFKLTQLQTTFSIINLVIDSGKPRLLNLKALLQAYRDTRFDVIRRRTRFLLDKAEARMHVLRGLHIAVQNIDEVVETIKTSKDVPEARSRLETRFHLTKIQSQAIVDMRLGRLTALEIEHLEAEIAKIEAEIRDYKDILARDERVYGIIREDIEDILRKYGDARRSVMTGDVTNFIDEDLIADDPMVVTFTREGYIKRTALSTYRSQGRGGRGVTGADMRDGDLLTEPVRRAGQGTS